ncbi:MAG: enoyl-CoA hydratase [Actinobacteria bacterium]|jgi:enoyl-CoA hydratase/carnithine racemase|nr:enoyl-CoA hydratase [Actinomycetota bacterium]
MNSILDQRQGPILRLTLNRPEKKNAITQEMYQSLADQINQAAGDFSIRAVVIDSNGDCFTSGNDINDFANNSPMGEGSPVFSFLFAIHNFPKPLIAAVKGRAVGIGTTMLLHCDYVTANSDAKFSMPFVSLGLVAEAGSSYLFPKLVGHAKASEIFLTGRTFSADEALQMGVINRVGSDELALAMEFATAVSEQPPNAVINTKALLKSASHEALNQVILAEGELFKMATESEEAQMAFMNFLAKKSKVK